MKNILIPTDFSSLTESALKVATEIARKNQAEVELLHIIEAPYLAPFSVMGDFAAKDKMDDVFVLKSMEKANKKMQQILDDVRYVGVRFLPKIKVGDPFTHFTNHIVEEPADLIITGTEGAHSFLTGIFNTSNAEKLVMKSDCMVLSVKNIPENFKIRNVLFATNFEDDHPEFLKQINKLQDLFDFKLHLVYVKALLSPKSDLQKIKQMESDFVEKHGIKNYDFQIYNDLTEYSGVTDYAKEIKADIIAISTHQHRGMHLFGGLSEDLVNYAEQPVLTFKAK